MENGLKVILWNIKMNAYSPFMVASYFNSQWRILNAKKVQPFNKSLKMGMVSQTYRDISHDSENTTFIVVVMY